MSETSNNEHSLGVSRRDFLKLAAVSVGAGVAVGVGLGEVIKNTDLLRKEPRALTPEIIAGIEVYGLNEKITSADTVDRFYSYLDDKSAESLDIRIGDKIKQRQELLSPNERYLEVVVRRSAYDSFILKKAETGVDFAEWIKTHVDVMNKCLKKATPPFEMKAVLRRILVIDDDMTKEFWDEDLYRQGGALGTALDLAWVNKFYPFSIDTDCVWAIADDYRDTGGGNFWEIRHENDRIIIGLPPEKVSFGQYFEFPNENDFLSGKNNLRFDMGLIHEWSHYLLNLPDEYGQDVHDASQRFKSFTFGTGSFDKPEISPYLAQLMQENIDHKDRNIYYPQDNIWKWVSSKNRPKKVEVTTRSEHQNLVNNFIEVRRVRLVDSSYYGNKSVPKNADQVSKDNSLIFGKNLFRNNSNCWHVKVINDKITREVFLPIAAFNMSKISGLESAKYDLIFSGYDDVSKTKQEVKLVDESKIDAFIQNEKDPYYSKMKVEGTNTWFVWFLRT